MVRGNLFLINPAAYIGRKSPPRRFCCVTRRGNVLEGTREVEPTAFFIHSRVHINAPGAVAVLHTHQPHATALTLLEDGRLEMCEQNALMFDGRIAYDDDYEGLALDGDEGDRWPQAWQ